MAMERYELEQALEKVIADSGVDPEQVIETLQLLLDRYQEELDDFDASEDEP